MGASSALICLSYNYQTALCTGSRRSHSCLLVSLPPTDDAPILVVHDASNLHLLYAVCDTVFMANSLAPGCTGESLAAPAVAGCAVLVGPHAGPSTIMVEDLNSAAVVAAEEAAAAVRSAGEWQPRCAPVIAAWSGSFDGSTLLGGMLKRRHGQLHGLWFR